MNKRIIGLNTVSLSNNPKVIGVSGSATKAGDSLGVLHGAYVNVLVIDELAARRMIEVDSAQ